MGCRLHLGWSCSGPGGPAVWDMCCHLHLGRPSNPWLATLGVRQGLSFTFGIAAGRWSSRRSIRRSKSRIKKSRTKKRGARRRRNLTPQAEGWGISIFHDRNVSPPSSIQKTIHSMYKKHQMQPRRTLGGALVGTNLILMFKYVPS